MFACIEQWSDKLPDKEIPANFYWRSIKLFSLCHNILTLVDLSKYIMYNKYVQSPSLICGIYNMTPEKRHLHLFFLFLRSDTPVCCVFPAWQDTHLTHSGNVFSLDLIGQVFRWSVSTIRMMKHLRLSLVRKPYFTFIQILSKWASLLILSPSAPFTVAAHEVANINRVSEESSSLCEVDLFVPGLYLCSRKQQWDISFL